MASPSFFTFTYLAPAPPHALLRAELTGGHPTSALLLLLFLPPHDEPSSKSGSVVVVVVASWNASANPLFPARAAQG
jgi:hypothetical protein